jgi:hypothetical protein
MAQEVLEQHLERVREPGHVVLGLKRVQAEDLVGSPADLEARAGAEAVFVTHLSNPIGATLVALLGALALLGCGDDSGDGQRSAAEILRGLPEGARRLARPLLLD